MLSYRSGFTLAELLIALAILGVIAVFTIPKILQSQGESQQEAVFRETVATLSAVMQKGKLEGSLTDASFYQYFADNLNYVKACNSNSLSQGCWSASQISNTEEVQPGFILHNGATISGFNNCCVAGQKLVNSVLIDWNGSAPPNATGQDTLRVTLCYGPVACDAGPSDYIIGSGPKGPGAMGPQYQEPAASVTLWESMFTP